MRRVFVNQRADASIMPSISRVAHGIHRVVLSGSYVQDDLVGIVDEASGRVHECDRIRYMLITRGDYGRVPETDAGRIDIQIVTHNRPIQAIRDKVQGPAALVKQRGIPRTLNGSIRVGGYELSIFVDHQDGA